MSRKARHKHRTNRLMHFQRRIAQRLIHVWHISLNAGFYIILYIKTCAMTAIGSSFGFEVIYRCVWYFISAYISTVTFALRIRAWNPTPNGMNFYRELVCNKWRRNWHSWHRNTNSADRRDSNQFLFQSANKLNFEICDPGNGTVLGFPSASSTIERTSER